MGLNSKNKIILEKLEHINKYVKLDRIQNVYSINSCWSVLKGVKYTEYEKIINGIKYARTTSEIVSIIQRILNGTYSPSITGSTTVADKLIDKLEDTSRINLANSEKNYLPTCNIWELEKKVQDILSIGNQSAFEVLIVSRSTLTLVESITPI